MVQEVHILDQRIKPNGRRDNFEDNIHSQILKSEIQVIANRIGNRCLLNSNFRNRLKHVSSKQKRAMELLKIIEENYLSNDKRQDYISESRICMDESEKALELLDVQLNEENFKRMSY